jgi:hypothetical protein
MQKLIFSILFLVASLSSLNAQTIKITRVPTTVEEFVEMRNQKAETPEGAAAMFLLALKIYTQKPELGKQCFVVIVDRKLLREGNVYKGFAIFNSDMSLIKSQMNKNKLIPNSYIKGSKTATNYAVNLPYVYEFSKNKYSGDKSKGEYKLFVACSGASSPRPMSFRRNNRGIWKVTNWSSVLVGIAKPEIDDDL